MWSDVGNLSIAANIEIAEVRTSQVPQVVMVEFAELMDAMHESLDELIDLLVCSWWSTIRKDQASAHILKENIPHFCFGRRAHNNSVLCVVSADVL